MVLLQRSFKVLPLLIGLSLLFTFGGTVSAASLTPSHQSTSNVSLTMLRGASENAPLVLHPLSLTSNCDVNPTNGSNGGILCAVASYATPCLNIRDISNGNVFTCVAPGTVIEITCQVDTIMPVGNPPFRNNWWDAGFLPDGRFGEFSDYYMDTEWTNNQGSPALGICATG